MERGLRDEAGEVRHRAGVGQVQVPQARQALVGTGLLASALTGNQVVAALISLSVFLLLWIIDNFGWLLPSPFDTLVVNLSLSVHFRPFAVGSIYLSDVGFFLSVALLTLLLSVRALARR